jgi:DNA-binding transcriptional LysR family regulator
MTLEQLRVFIAVAEQQHFTRAAEELCITQPAVSASVAAIESRYKVQLFHRIGRRVELSEAGHLLLQEARLVLQQVSVMEQALQELIGLERGVLQLGASKTLAHSWLSPLVHQFHREHPGVRIILNVTNTAQVIQQLLMGNIELGLVEGEANSPSLCREVIGGDTMILVVGPKHPWWTRKKISLEDMQETNWVVREVGSGSRQFLESTIATYGIQLSQLKLVLELPTCTMVKSAVEEGCGAAFISTLMLTRELEEGTLRQLSLPNIPQLKQKRNFYSVTHRERQLSEAGQAFSHLLKHSASIDKISSVLTFSNEEVREKKLEHSR